MATYLLTWNPKRWPGKELQRGIRKIEKSGTYEDYWTCGVTKKIRPGDRVFLMKLGEEPRGIVASGYVKEGASEGGHWDERERRKGKRALYVHVVFDTILDPDGEIFPLDRLRGGVYRQVNWTPQASGVTIPEEVAKQLEKDWEEFNKRTTPLGDVSFAAEADVDGVYYEGAKKRVFVNAYERNAKAREECIRHYGVRCCVCGFDFEERYGEIGRGFIHVHHVRPLSTIGRRYKLNAKRDLRPVCPNCHEMLHRRSPAFEIDELKELLRRRGWHGG